MEATDLTTLTNEEKSREAYDEHVSSVEEYAEVIVDTGIMGDELCQRCGTRFMVDGYCERGHCKPPPKSHQ